MKMIKTFSNLAFGLLLMSTSLTFGQPADQRKLELVVETSHTDRVVSVAISPDRKTLASSGGNIILRDGVSGRFIKQLGGEENQEFVVFSPDGKMLASCDERQMILWDISTGVPVKKWDDKFYGVNTIAFSPDGKTLATTFIDGTITIWDVEKGKINQFHAHETALSVAFSPDGSVLASSGVDKEFPVKIWDAKTWRLLNSLKGHVGDRFGTTSVWSVEFSPDGKKIATSSSDNTGRIWNWKSGEALHILNGHSDLNRAIGFSPDGEILATSGDGQIKLWNTSTGKLILPLGEKQTKKYPDTVLSLKFAGDGSTLISGITDSYTAGDAGFAFWNFRTGKIIQTLVSKNISSVAFSPDGNDLAVNFGGEIKLLNLSNIQDTKTLRGHSDKIWTVEFSPDGRTFASASKDKTVKLWDVSSGKELSTLSGHSEEVRAVAFSPDGKSLASGSEDTTIKIWDVNNYQEIKTLRSDDSSNAFDDQVISVAFSPDGKFLVGGSWRKVRIWDAVSGKKVKTIQVDSGWIFGLKFSPDGKTILAGSRDKLKIINLANDQVIDVNPNDLPDWANHDSFIRTNKTKLEIAAEGATLKLLDFSPKKEIVKIMFLDENDWAVVTPDGRFDASEGAQKLMHYTYGLEVINLEQLKAAYYEPGLLQKLLGFTSEPLRPTEPLKDVKLFPEIVSQTIAPNSTKLVIKLKNRGGGIGKVQVFIGNELGNKLVVEDARDEKLKQNPNVPEAILEVDLSGTIYLKGKENKITVVTSNYLKETGKGNIQSRGAEIVWKPDGGENFQLPTLYAIVGGVSDYEGERLDLRFAAKDAEDFSNALSLGAKKLFCDKSNPNCFDKVRITTLSTSRAKPEEQPKKENFRRAFADVAARAKPEDIIVVYLAGHGVSLGNGTDSYFYLTKEARTASADELAKVLKTSTISSEELTDWLTPNKDNENDIFIKAMKQVVILDTCASGNAAGQLALTAKRDLSGDQIRAVEFLKDKTGTFVLMASTADAPSYEASQFGQGLLTYSLLQAMKGAALDKGEYVDIQQLFSYAQKQVPQLAQNIGGVQRPIVSAPLGKTFVIGQMTDDEKKNLNLPSPKPLLLRPLLTDPETGDDDLKLIPALRKMLDADSSYEVMQRTGKGEPKLIYIDDDNFPGAVRLTGTYTVEGRSVRVKAFLRQDGKTIAALPEVLTTEEKIADELLKTVREALTKIQMK